MYTLKKMSLESSMEALREELSSTKKQLAYEEKWRNKADYTHKSLLQEKSQLQARYI